MVRRKEKLPQEGELIIGRVVRVNPYSAFVQLEEYPVEGMVHISEVARKWVKDIRNWVKEGETVVCYVLSIDKGKGHINLSIKRVDGNTKNKRLQAWKSDAKGEKLLFSIAREMKLNENQMYEKIGFLIQETFKDMLEVFTIGYKEGVEGLVRRGVPEDWSQKIETAAREKMSIKETKISGFLVMKCFQGDGIDIIKSALEGAKKQFGVEIKYISAPRYSLSINTKDPKKGQKSIDGAASMIKEHLEKHHGECAFYDDVAKMPKV